MAYRHPAIRDPKIPVLPCPFCGVDGEQTVDLMVVVRHDMLDEESADGVWVVVCGNCGAVGPGACHDRYSDRPETEWNNRQKGP
jgi:uncharacterized Zn finger protein